MRQMGWLKRCWNGYWSLHRRSRNIMVKLSNWLSMQHVTSLILLYLAFSLSARPAPSLEAALIALNARITPNDASIIFAFCAGILFLKPVHILVYRFATLPLVVYGLIIAWYVLWVDQSLALAPAGFGIGLWAILQIAATKDSDIQ